MEATFSNAMNPDHRNLRALLKLAMPPDRPPPMSPLATVLSWLQDGREFYVLVGTKGDGRRLRKLLRALPEFRKHAALRGVVKICPIFKPGQYLICDLTWIVQICPNPPAAQPGQVKTNPPHGGGTHGNL